jgi:acyl-CoA thioester hydrolase
MQLEDILSNPYDLSKLPKKKDFYAHIQMLTDASLFESVATIIGRMSSGQSGHQVTLRVRYAETDQMGVVYHANYLVWMEIGRVEYCRERGIRYKDLETNERIYMAVVEATCRYVAPARYDDEVSVATTVLQATARTMKFSYQISLAGNQKMLAHGNTSHVFCDANMRMTKLPERLHQEFGIVRRKRDTLIG